MTAVRRPLSDTMIDIGIITGFMTSSYVVMQAGPHIKPMAISLARSSAPYVRQLGRKVQVVSLKICKMAEYIRTKGGKKNFVRWLGSHLPSVLFGPTPRICVLMQGVDYASSDQIIRDRVRPTLSDLEEFNDEGIIIAYAKTSETDSDTMGLAYATNDLGETWGNSIKFEPCIDGCSTPKRIYSPVPDWLANRCHRSSVIEDSAAQEANAAKIAALEAELQKMKAMCEMILQNQTQSAVPPPGVAPAPLAPVTTTVAPPPPPPPPPAPMMPSGLSKTNVIKLKTKSELENLKTATKTEVANSYPPSMSDVLKGLSGVKLRPVARSPGGTPFRQKPELNSTDPASMLAAALKKRFARVQSSPAWTDTEEENSMNSNDKENIPGSGAEDSFTQSPSFYNYRVPALFEAKV